jgi:hypothetical protein
MSAWATGPGHLITKAQRRQRALVALPVREWLVPCPIPSQPERLQVIFRKLTVFRPVTLGFPEGRWPIVKA